MTNDNEKRVTSETTHTYPLMTEDRSTIESSAIYRNFTHHCSAPTLFPDEEPGFREHYVVQTELDEDQAELEWVVFNTIAERIKICWVAFCPFCGAKLPLEIPPL